MYGVEGICGVSVFVVVMGVVVSIFDGIIISQLYEVLVKFVVDLILLEVLNYLQVVVCLNIFKICKDVFGCYDYLNFY